MDQRVGAKEGPWSVEGCASGVMMFQYDGKRGEVKMEVAGLREGGASGMSEYPVKVIFEGRGVL
jgi:hypothetical protein